MKTTRILTILVLALGLTMCWAGVSKAGPIGTAFTYQGRLIDANSAADGEYDFQFKLYDANATGTQLGSDVNKPDVDVIDGYFTVDLDFGAGVFDGNAVWLDIGVRPGEESDPCVYTSLVPRQEIMPTPYAHYAKTAGTGNSLDAADGLPKDAVYVDNEGRVGIGTTSPEVPLDIANPSSGTVVKVGRITGSPSIEARSDAAGGWLIMDSNGEGNVGLNFYQDSDVVLVMGGGNVGIGRNPPEAKLHVYEPNSGNYAYLGSSSYGVYGNSTNGYGVYGYSGGAPGVRGQSSSGYGVSGTSSSNYGVFGRNDSSSNWGILGTSNVGVHGGHSSTGNYGQLGTSDYGAYGQHSTSGNFGALGRSDYGAYGKHDSSGNYGYLGGSSYGVYGSSSLQGVRGTSNTGTGVYGISQSGEGVLGTSNGSYGVWGYSDSSYGVYGSSNTSYAGYFNGDVYVTSDVSALSFTDRTPYPRDLATAYQAVMSMEKLPDGKYMEYNKEYQLDHSKLSDFVRSENGNRDLSATVSAHNEVLKDLIRKLRVQEQLIEKQNTQIEQLAVALERKIQHFAGTKEIHNETD